MFRSILLAGAAVPLMAFQSPPGPDGQPPIPSPTMTPMTPPSPTPTPSVTPMPDPTPAPTPSATPLPLPTDQSPEAKDAGGSGETQGDDQPPKR